MQVAIRALYDDYCSFVEGAITPLGFDELQKIYQGQSADHYKICQIAYYEGVPVDDLVDIPESGVPPEMDEFYRSMAAQHNLPYETVSAIGQAVIKRYKATESVAQKSGPRPRDWSALDKQYLPEVTKVVDLVYSDKGKPGRVTATRVERLMGLPQKQLQNLPRCLKYVETHMEQPNEYRARRVSWAVKELQASGMPITKHRLTHLVNYKVRDLRACCRYIEEPEIRSIIADLVDISL